MEKFFGLKERGTDVKTEILAGITTFMTIAYILAIIPLTLSKTGMDTGGVFTATVIASLVATAIMGLYANYPFVLAPGMGVNAFFVYYVVLGPLGKTWQFALTAVLLEGIIFILLSFVKAREAIFDSIPMNLKHAVSVGIGLFITFIGLSSVGLVVKGDGTIVALGNIISEPVLLTIIGIIITGFLLEKKINGAILIGIIATTLLGIPFGVTMVPEGFRILSLPPSIKDVAFQFVGFKEIFSGEMLIVVITFLFVDVFDTVGTLAGVASKAGMLDDDGKLPRVGKALMSDAIGTFLGACLGTSTITTVSETSAGVAVGGRTGLTSLSTAGMFFLALFFAPLFTMIPPAATAPALVIVGLYMMGPVAKIDFTDFTEAIPAFLTIVIMPFAYSIADGIAFGMLSYVLLKLITRRGKEVSKIMWVLGVLFVLKYIFI